MPSISIFDIFKIGVGPSSSHTVGPMKAAEAFIESVVANGAAVAKVQVTLYGSLAYTGKGHATDSAILLGLEGSKPETIDPNTTDTRLRIIHRKKMLDVRGIGVLPFDPEHDLVFELHETLPRHTNGMRFTALAASGPR